MRKAALVRTGFAMIIDAQPDLEVVGGCGNGRAAIDLAGHLRPDVVVMDVPMPVLDGIEATPCWRARAWRTPSRCSW